MSENVIGLLGAQIAKIRKDRDFSQNQLAESVHVSVETISRLERGVTTPSLKTLEKISLALRIPLKEFFNFDHLPEPTDSSKEEFSKLVNFLKNKSENDIRLSYHILKNIFQQIEKNYRLKEK